MSRKAVRNLLFLTCLISLASWGSWKIFFDGKGFPFSEIRWREGKAEIKVGEDWRRLYSLEGVAMDTLIADAIENWGPAYQHQFEMQWEGLLQMHGNSPGWWVNWEIIDAGKVESGWNFQTRGRWERLLSKKVGAGNDGDCPGGLVAGKGKTGWGKLESEHAGEWLKKEQLVRDLGFLRTLLREQYSYQENVPMALNSLCEISQMVSSGMGRPEFGRQIQMALASLNDIHARVAFRSSGIRLPDKNLPLDLLPLGEKFLALEFGKQQLLDPDFPILQKIEGIPVAELWRRAQRMGGNSLAWMQRIQYLLPPDHLQGRKALNLTLQSPAGTTREMRLPLGRPAGAHVMSSRIIGNILPGQIGHLHLRLGLFADDGYLRDIRQEMYGLAQTKGLIFDLRGNPGGHRNAIPLLLQYFLPLATHPHIINYGRYVMPPCQRPPEAAEVLQRRFLYPAHSSKFSSAQATAIQKALPGLTNSTDSMVSEPHFFLSPDQVPEEVVPYTQPLVVLIDGQTASATELILCNLKGQPQVTIMGQASIGGSGHPIRFQLPESKIQLDLSTMRSYQASGQPISFTTPDVLLEPRLEAWMLAKAQGQDYFLEAARQFLLTRLDSLEK